MQTDGLYIVESIGTVDTADVLVCPHFRGCFVYFYTWLGPDLKQFPEKRPQSVVQCHAYYCRQSCQHAFDSASSLSHSCTGGGGIFTYTVMKFNT